MSSSVLPSAAGLRSFFMAGFECASQRRADGKRLDLLASTRHDVCAATDYALVAGRGMRAARDGMRWHLIEKTAGFYDWSSVAPMAKAAQGAGVQIVWDLCHYGYPDWLDVWSPSFPERFARFSKAAAQFLKDQSDEIPYFCPVNEMSFWAWAGGDMGRFNPTTKGRGDELKRQLARAAIASIDAVREVDPRARFIVAEPCIHVSPNGDSPQALADAADYCNVQYAAHDMLVGRLNPELGGSPDKLDIVGVNYYPDNQWVLGGPPVPLGQYNYRPFRELLAQTAERYGRPVIVSELGAENTAPPGLALLRRPGGRGRAEGRSERRGHVPLSDLRLSGLGQRSPLRRRPVRERRPRRRAPDLRGIRRRTRATAPALRGGSSRRQ
ncbi:beta-glucosidase [Chenggangzhangella methanolivorans]|uniref:beta-glucosidase n=1 Tax=Chenggangzhangella methanolivorans TaxID=1437009 RepID=UPI0021BD375B|nr:beta-glucosidase [Chenggangzhangella methanolivorans]